MQTFLSKEKRMNPEMYADIFKEIYMTIRIEEPKISIESAERVANNATVKAIAEIRNYKKLLK